MTTPVSIVIPCYNQARYLGEALQSCLNQHYPTLEVIVVNDGSTDDTRAVATAAGSAIVYIEQDNLGLSAARNVGIRAAQGSYIALLDSDDACLPGRIATQAHYLDTHPQVGMVASDALLYDGCRLLGLKSAVSGAPAHPADFRAETVSYCPTPSTALIRRECFARAGYFDERLRRAGEDWLFAVQLGLHYALAYLPLPTILYRLHPASASASTSLLDTENRRAAAAAISWEQFPALPAAMRARLLYYRCATAWRSEPRRVALGYALRAVLTDPAQVPYGLRVVGRGLQRSLHRSRL